MLCHILHGSQKMIKQGYYGLVRADLDRKEYPHGAVLLIMSHNTHEKQYQVTDVLDSIATNINPYILENEETGFKITKEQFDTGEFLPYNMVEPFTFEPELTVVKFLRSTVGIISLNVLVFCAGALLALEFVK